MPVTHTCTHTLTHPRTYREYLEQAINDEEGAKAAFKRDYPEATNYRYLLVPGLFTGVQCFSSFWPLFVSLYGGAPHRCSFLSME